MKRNIICVLLALVMMLSACCAYAEQVEEAVPSKTVADLTVAEGTEVEETVVIAVAAVEAETEEAQVFEEIAAVAEESSVVEYFNLDAQAQIQEALPEFTDMSSLEMDEFFALDQEGYDAEHGDVTATFEFVTPYEENTVLVAMVGLLPNAEDEAAEEAEIVWYAQQATVVDGKVQIIFTQEVLTLMQQQEAVLALLRSAPSATV